jgi:lipopolysaccharide transport system ATP-binding protein
MKNVIEIVNLSKLYRLGEIGSGTISRDLERWYRIKILGQEDPFLKIGETNDRSKKGSGDVVYSLKDINLNIQQGEALGIIGKNGAGKSTLLKIISRVTSPTIGKIKIKGRIASLLEVGTGFHPELTGRENIYLNGAILGMRKKEITRKFDEIIDFSGVERYIDTPVKRYSSGMYVRLAFAVAAHLESEILIVDEVLAVGDAEFQKRCLGKMGEVSKGEGRTVLFVSHNMGAIRELCNLAILLNNGEISNIGTSNNIVREYLSIPNKILTPTDFLNDYNSRRGNGEVRFSRIEINDNQVPIDPTSEIKVYCQAKVFKTVNNIYFYIEIKDPMNGNSVTDTRFVRLFEETVNAGSDFSFEFIIPANTFRTGVFPLYIWLGIDIELGEYPYDVIDGVFSLTLDSDKRKDELGYYSGQPNGVFNLNYKILNLKLIN